MTQAGSRQHVIPASHIGSFSSGTESPKRNRSIWFRREGMPKAISVKAESVGIDKHVYTIKDTSHIDERYVDKTWDYIENNLYRGVQDLENHIGSPSLDGLLWSTILVPFVAQLFIRGKDYNQNLLARAPYLEKLKEVINEEFYYDNMNMNRLIDFQINCGLLCFSSWRLVHNQTDIPFILNDLGYATFNGKRFGVDTGYLVPMSKELMLIIYKRGILSKPFRPVGIVKSTRIHLPQNVVRDKYRIMYFNERIAQCAIKEIYGAKEDIVNQHYSIFEEGKNDAGVGPIHIQQRHFKDKDLIGLFNLYLNVFNVDEATRKGAYGGREIYLIEDSNSGGSYGFGWKEL
ncbi:DUF4238 domain-containing protein [Paenibacillus sp. GP183]|uniref:DUF4238 domain-containing protein n=1 Tax=Paenibacillus sp. GP183 TaxID=1882751 RepID=UPI00089481EE|nr:DUF4238 domain-containing protein [Paenibacillus sp. GP183]SED15062.1 Protein of unknown function [Paenibacillus sp. GP183]